SRTPEVLMDKFDNSAINYRIRVWTTEFDADERIRDRIRVALFYAFRRNGIEIPYPMQVEINKPFIAQIPRDLAGDQAVLAKVSVFASLSDEERGQLTDASKRVLFGKGEMVVREGEARSSMFVIATGEVVVVLESQRQEVARIGAGGFFGEMSLLTGAPRN